MVRKGARGSSLGGSATSRVLSGAGTAQTTTCELIQSLGRGSCIQTLITSVFLKETACQKRQRVVFASRPVLVGEVECFTI